MRIAAASDTLGLLPEIQGEYDLFVHCGNFCPIIEGDNASIEDQISWLHEQFCPWISTISAEYKVIIPGHNDLAVNKLEPKFEYHLDGMYLRDQTTTIAGKVIHGMPWVPMSKKKFLGNKPCFVASSKTSYKAAIDCIPEETNILITRMPPFNILDTSESGLNIGDKTLMRKVKILNELDIHLFGFATHVGCKHILKGKTLFANACLKAGGPAYLEIVS